MLKLLASALLLILCAAVFAMLHAVRVLPEAHSDALDDAEAWRRAFAKGEPDA